MHPITRLTTSFQPSTQPTQTTQTTSHYHHNPTHNSSPLNQPQTITIHLSNKRVRNLKQVLPMVMGQNTNNKKIELLANDNHIQELTGLQLVAQCAVIIKLHNNQISSLSSFSSTNTNTLIFPYLSQLYLQYNNICSLQGLQSCTFPSLIRLSLNNNKLTSQACDQVLGQVKAPQLRILTLDGNFIKQLTFLRKLDHFKKLITLPLSGNRIQGAEVGVLGVCQFVAKLSNLQLHSNIIQRLQGLSAKMNNVRKMTLNSNRIVSLQPLIGCELTQLTFLDLQDNNITSTHFLIRLQSPKLIDLKLSKNKLIKMPIHQLRYSCLPFLQQILLKNNQITGNILEIMVAFADVQEVREQFYREIVDIKGQCGENRMNQLLLKSYNSVNNVNNIGNSNDRNLNSTQSQTILNSSKQTIKITLPVKPVKPTNTGNITIPKNEPKFGLYNDNSVFSMMSCWRNKLIMKDAKDGRIIYAKLKQHFKKLSFLQF